MKKFIKCDCCGKKIYFGDDIFFHERFCGTYCSKECFADTYCEEGILDMNHADNCGCKIYDEVGIKREIESKENEIRKLQLEVEMLKKC